MTELEQQFHKAMIDVYKQAKSECGYNATYFLGMVTDHGGLGAARKLLGTAKPSEGFTKLWEYHRLNLTMEAQVIRPEFAPLFSEDEIAAAKNRLTEYGYKFDQ